MDESDLLNLFKSHCYIPFLNNGEHNKEYVSQCFNLFYRALGRIKNLSNTNDGNLKLKLQEIIDGGINFLNSDQFNLEVFREYDELSKLRILQSVISMANSQYTYQYGQTIINKLSEITIDDLCKGSENDNIRKKILLNFAKIPNNKDTQLNTLGALLGIEDWDNLSFDSVDLESQINKEALLTFAKIPSDTDNQINALYALYKIKDNRYKDQIKTTAKNIKGYVKKEAICVENYKYLGTLCNLNQNNNNYEENGETYQQNGYKIRNNYHQQESPRW